MYDNRASRAVTENQIYHKKVRRAIESKNTGGIAMEKAQGLRAEREADNSKSSESQIEDVFREPPTECPESARNREIRDTKSGVHSKPK